MDWTMLWKDLLAGFLIAGMLSAFVPGGFWQSLFLSGAAEGWRLLSEALIRPLVAMLTFVYSIGKVLLAATLWGGGGGVVGVLAFLYADLIVLSPIDDYRHYSGLRMAMVIAAALYVAMVVAALVIGGLFALIDLTPSSAPTGHASTAMFAFDYSFYLNVAAAALAAWLFWKACTAPMHDHAHHHQASHWWPLGLPPGRSSIPRMPVAAPTARHGTAHDALQHRHAGVAAVLWPASSRSSRCGSGCPTRSAC